jgi:uncharacterized membrane protein
MKEWLVLATEVAVPVIDGMALIIICAGTVQAFVSALRMMITVGVANYERRNIWLRYGRTLVAGLTFQLAADIVESSITTDWNAVGRLAAIAVIRTFLNYFLERDLTDIRERREAWAEEQMT